MGSSSQPNAPEFLAWHVAQSKPQVCLPSLKKSNNAKALLRKGEKSFWNKVGAAWRHRDGKGYTLQLEVVPINGRIVLRLPLDEPNGGDGQNENRSA